MTNLYEVHNEELQQKSLKELIDFQDKLTLAIEERKVTEREEVMKQINELANNSGFSLDELIKNKPKKKAVIKFRNHENHDETWTGRGRKPAWLQAKLDEGAFEDDYKI